MTQHTSNHERGDPDWLNDVENGEETD